MATTKPKPNGVASTDKYPMIEFNRIKIADRPADGEEESILFYNPRSPQSFTPESMASLCLSIRSDGLQSPPIIRISDGGKKVELIAGERRYRSIKNIVDNDLPVFDEDAKKPVQYSPDDIIVCRGIFGLVVSQNENDVLVQIFDQNNNLTQEERTFLYSDCYPTVSGREYYSKVPCKVHYDIDDSRALRLAFTENDKSESLSTQEEIVLVERLQKRGMKVADISELLGSNDTWVSQTANFRNELPSHAFDCLLTGSMKRHTAVKIMSYHIDDRQGLWDSIVEAERIETEAKIQQAEDKQIEAEDTAVLYEEEAKVAAKHGDYKKADSLNKKAESAKKKAEKAESEKAKAKSEKGSIKTGHVQRAAAKSGLSPKKAKVLSKEEIESLLSRLEEVDEGDIDPICKKEIPVEHVSFLKVILKNLLSGNLDHLSYIRSHMIEQGEWKIKSKKFSEDEDDEDEDFDEDFDAEDMEDGENPSDEDLEDLDEELFDDDYDGSDFDLAAMDDQDFDN